MTKIAFHSNQLGIFGTEVAMYDYALYNNLLLNNKSIIICPEKENIFHNKQIEEKFKQLFKVYKYKSLDELNFHLKNEKVDIFYTIKAGFNDGIIAEKPIKTCVHAVFKHKNEDWHGDIFAYVSEWLSKIMTNGLFPFVPHMINPIGLTSDEFNLRENLNIPKDCFVIGRYGSNDDFNIQFAKDAIKNIINKRDDLYFIFINTDKFLNHDRILHLDKLTTISSKNTFINTCDCMIHARNHGETFGLTIGECAIKNKPTITYKPHNEKQYSFGHIEILKDKGLFYTSKNDLEDLLLSINKNDLINRNWDAYSLNYSPENVMKIFKDIFIDEKCHKDFKIKL